MDVGTHFASLSVRDFSEAFGEVFKGSFIVVSVFASIWKDKKSLWRIIEFLVSWSESIRN